MKDELLKDLNFNKSFDVNLRHLFINSKNIYLIYLNFLTDDKKIANIIYSLNELSTISYESIENHLIIHSLQIEKNEKKVLEQVFKGQLAIIIENEQLAIIVDTRKYPGRSIAEPDSEKVVRGSRDGFTEQISVNIALVRRRINSSDLIIERYTLGSTSKTDIALIYIKDKVDKKSLNIVKEKLSKIKINELTMSDKALEELLLSSKLKIYPLVKYTERPDTFARQIHQGMFGIIVDTSPSAMVAPVSIFDHLQHAEEYRQSPIAGTYLRIIRFLGIMIGMFILPVWYLLIKNDISINGFSSFFIKEQNNTAIFFQIIQVEISIELIRMASIHTPSALATSMGLIAGVVIGEMAIKLGIFSIQVALLGSLSALSSYITPSYELSIGNKIVKLFIIIMIYFFNFIGFYSSLILIFIYLAFQKSFGRSYLYPLMPFNFKKLIYQIIRKPYDKE